MGRFLRGGLIIAAVFSIGFVGAKKAEAADPGGDCCADLEQRVAELEATTVTKGNKKVTVELYGDVNEAVEFWDDGGESNVYTTENNYKSTRFGLKGTGQIAPGWTAGYWFEAEDRPALSSAVSQLDASNNGDTGLYVRESNMFISSDKYGTVTWGLFDTAKYNTTKDGMVIKGLVDTVNSDYFFNSGFFLRTAGTHGSTGLSDITFGDIARCYSSGSAAFNCSSRRDEVAYETPVWGGFSFKSSWAANNYWSLAARYKADWGKNWSAAAAVGYENDTDEGVTTGVPGFSRDIDEWSGSASIINNPTGLFVFSAFSTSKDNDSNRNGAGIFTHTSSPAMDAYDIAGGIHKSWIALGATTLWGGYTNVQDGLAGAGGATRAIAPGSFYGIGEETEITGSEVTRWYLAADQAIDSAQMDLYLVYQHIDPSVSLVDSGLDPVVAPLDDFDVVYAGARIYF